MTKKEYTPQEIAKVLAQIIAEQKNKGYKPMWAKHEMERRAEKAQRNGSFYACHTGPSELGWNAYYVANGDATVEDYLEGYKDNWEMYQEMAE